MDKLEELAILLLAEGSVRYHNGYEIQFTNTDAVLKNYFRSLVESLGYKSRDKNEKQMVVYSKGLALALQALSPSFRTKAFDKARGIYPEATFSKTAFENPAETLKLFFSCEGGVTLSGRKSNEVIVRVCHPMLKQQVKEMLNSLGINFTERGNGLISIKRKLDVLFFKEKINFVHGVLSCRGKNKGVEKRVLLNRLIQQYSPVHTARQAIQARF